MIDTLYLANKIEDALNENQLGIKFLIFADEGDLRKTTQKGVKVNKYTHGILQTISSNIIPIRNITYQTLNTQLTIMASLFDGEFVEVGQFEREQSQNLIDIKKCISTLIERFNGATIPFLDQGKTFMATITMSPAINGQKMSFGEKADCLPLYVNIGFSLFENGVNANDCHIKLNGEDIYFENCVISKIRVADQNEFASEKGGRTIAVVGGKSIDIISPVVQSRVNRNIMTDILGNENNTAVAVVLETPLGNCGFVGTFGNNVLSLQTAINGGYNISVVQSKESLLKYDYRWNIENVDVANVEKPYLPKRLYFWGDGTYTDTQESGEPTTHIYEDGKANHTIRVYNYNSIVIG